jgi:membrane fusion protein (multidrug efflux system)
MHASFRPRVSRLILPAAALLALSLTGCGRKSGPAGPAGAAPEVTVVTLHPETLTLTRELPGRTSPFAVAEVRPQVTGLVRERLFVEGATVTAGQPLYQLDDAPLRAELARAEAALARAQAAAELARLNARRIEELSQASAVSRQEYESSVAVHRQAVAEVQAADAAVAHARVMAGYGRITSPIAGRIGRSTVTQGALVTANQDTALATVQQLDPIYVDVTQSSREWVELRQGIDAGTLAQPNGVPVAILLEDGTRYPHDGRLAFSEVSVNPTTGSIALRIVVPNPDGLLLPGMYVRAVVGIGIRENAVLVPQAAVIRDPKGGASVLLVNSAGQVEPRPIVVQYTVGDRWVVESGLTGSERVIVQGLQKVRAGLPVTAVEAGAQPATK